MSTENEVRDLKYINLNLEIHKNLKLTNLKLKKAINLKIISQKCDTAMKIRIKSYQRNLKTKKVKYKYKIIQKVYP